MDDIDLSPWALRDELTLAQAADLWAGLLPSMRLSERKQYPGKRAAAREWLRLLKVHAADGRLPAERRQVTTTVPCVLVPIGSSDPWLQADDAWTSEFGRARRPVRQVLQQVTVPCAWELATVKRADLRAFAQSIGQRPAFLFREAPSGPAATETAKDRNERIAKAVLDGCMTKEQALTEGVKPDNLKRILTAERKRRGTARNQAAGDSSAAGRGMWSVLNASSSKKAG